jgi:lipoprotein LpqH
MNRVIAGVAGLAAAAAVLVGCSDDKGGPAPAATAAGGSQVSTGGGTEVKVDGNTYTITGEATGADIKNPMQG